MRMCDWSSDVCSSDRYNENLLRNRLENQGFFQAAVVSDTTIKNSKATVTYTASPYITYRINSVTFEVDSSKLGKVIKATQPASQLQADRKSEVMGKSVSARFDWGCRRIIKKKK